MLYMIIANLISISLSLGWSLMWSQVYDIMLKSTYMSISSILNKNTSLNTYLLHDATNCLAKCNWLFQRVLHIYNVSIQIKSSLSDSSASLHFDTISRIRWLLNFSNFFTSCACSVLYCKHWKERIKHFKRTR